MRDVATLCASASHLTPLLEPGSNHLVLTFSVLHYPEKLCFAQDESLKGAMSYISLPNVGPNSKRAQMAAALDDMFSTFLDARLTELVPGGHLVCVMDGETQERNHQFSHLYAPLERAIKTMIEVCRTPPISHRDRPYPVPCMTSLPPNAGCMARITRRLAWSPLPWCAG